MTIYSIADVFCGFVEAFMMFMLYETFCKKREQIPSWCYGVGVVVLTAMINVSNILFNYGMMNIVVMCFSCFLISYMYSSSFFMRIIISVLSYLLMGIVEIIVLFAITLIYGITVSDVTSSNEYTLLGIILSKAFAFFLIYMVHYKFKKSKFVSGVSYWLLICTMFFSTTATVFLIFKLSYNIKEAYMFNISILCSLGLLLTTFMALYLYERLAEQTHIIRTQKENQKYLKDQLKHFDEMLITQNQIKKFRHDYNNFIIGLQAYIDDNNCPGAKEYLDSLKNKLYPGKNTFETGNVALDAVISTKKAIAESKGIIFSTQIQIPSNLETDPTDMCIIFGNALDNAIEACDRVNNSDKKISIVLTYQNETLFCKIENTSPELKNSFLKTSKNDKKNHGYGFENIKSTLKKYNSVPETEYADNKFLLKFVIFMNR